MSLLYQQSAEIPTGPPMHFEVPEDLQHALHHVLEATADSQEYQRYLAGIVGLVWPVSKGDDCEGIGEPIKLTVLDFDHTDSTRIFSTSARTVKVGLREVSDFCNMSIRLSEHLTRGFTRRMTTAGDVRGPSAFVSIDDYPQAALRVMAGSEIDGYAQPLREKMTLSALQALNRAGVGTTDEPLDVPIQNFGDMKLDADRGDYHVFLDSQDGPYLIRLHHWILCNVLFLVLSHEVGHIKLGHFQQSGTSNVENRRQEAAADDYALRAFSPVDWNNLKAALWVFGFLNKEKIGVANDLTHPYSLDRLQLLGRTLIRLANSKAVVDDVSGIIRQFQLGHGSFNVAGTTTTVEVRSASDLDSAYLLITTSLDAGGYANGPPIIYKVALSYVDAIDPNVEHFTATAVLNLSGEIRKNSYQDNYGYASTEFDEKTGNIRIKGTATIEVPTPPAWRLHAHAGVLKITAVEQIDSTADSETVQHTANQTMPRVSWSEPVASLLALEQLRKGVSLEQVSPHDLLKWSDWCEEFGHKSDAIALRSLIIEEAPLLAGYRAAIVTIDELRRIGEVTRSGKLALCYIRDVPALRPGLYYAISEAALQEGVLLAAYENAFLEIHGLGDWGGYFEAAEKVFVRCLSDPNSEEMSLLRWWHQYYLLSFGWRGTLPVLRRKRLRKCIDVMQAMIQRYGEFISFRQLQAEVTADLSRLGDKGAATKAAEMFAGIIEDHPWFVPAFIQACYLAMRVGNKPAALDLLQRAQGLAPFHPQVREAREMFYNSAA